MSADNGRVYLDTSALLPLYRDEALTEPAERLLEALPGAPAISGLTEVEVASAVSRWVRLKELGTRDAKRIDGAFGEDLRAGVFRRVAFEETLFWQAHQWLTRRDTALRTLDVLHLACVVAHDCTLVTADKAFADAANALGVAVRVLSAE